MSAETPSILQQHHNQGNGISASGIIEPPSSEPTFKTDFKSNSNRQGGITTTQHSLTMENYNAIKKSSYYDQPIMSPPPLVYSRDKRILIEVAKAFGLRHGYRIVINKNDNRRVILLCSRHGLNKVSPRAKKENAGETASFRTNAKSHKCQCPFRAEIQLKQRRKLWILKPITMEHNHEILQLPVTIDNSTSATLPSKTITGGRINQRYIVASMCTASNHLNCFFENNDLNKLLGLDEAENTVTHPEDDLKLITTELINNITWNESPYTNSKRKQSNKTKRVKVEGTPESEALLATELMKAAKRARKDQFHNRHFTLMIKNAKPRNFYKKFPKFNIDEPDLEIKFAVNESEDQNTYTFQLYNEQDTLLFSGEVLSLHEDIDEITSQDMVKKITDVIKAFRKEEGVQDDADEEDDLKVDTDQDIANITAVAVKAQQQNEKDNGKDDSDAILVDPELTTK